MWYNKWAVSERTKETRENRLDKTVKVFDERVEEITKKVWKEKTKKCLTNFKRCGIINKSLRENGTHSTLKIEQYEIKRPLKFQNGILREVRKD